MAIQKIQVADKPTLDNTWENTINTLTSLGNLRNKQIGQTDDDYVSASEIAGTAMAKLNRVIRQLDTIANEAQDILNKTNTIISNTSESGGEKLVYYLANHKSKVLTTHFTETPTKDTLYLISADASGSSNDVYVLNVNDMVLRIHVSGGSIVNGGFLSKNNEALGYRDVMIYIPAGTTFTVKGHYEQDSYDGALKDLLIKKID